MNESTVAIVGSGIAATTIAYFLTKKGYDVALFEKGPEYPYPHNPQFREKILYLHDNHAFDLPPDLKNLTLSGDYQKDLNDERGMVVGGSATHWEAITLRMNPKDFKTRSLYGYGEDWPLTYDDLESFYCKAEGLLGVSGTDADNPFAPPRSQPYPLSPFELSYDDAVLADRLRRRGLILHTTPQARTRESYNGRAGCMNFGACKVCPIGARYSPNHHLQRAMATGLCKVHPNVSVKRIILDKSGKAKALVYQPNRETTEKEHAAKVIVVAAGAIESPRLLLLSAHGNHPNGLGNQGGHLGQHLSFHHLWYATVQHKDRLYPGRVGAETGQSHQFREPIERGRHGGIKVEFSANRIMDISASTTPSEIIENMKPMRHRRILILHAESVPSPKKYVTLSEKRDRFGDSYAHVHYESSVFDQETYRFAREISDRFTVATGGEIVAFTSLNEFSSGAHHMGTCRMGRDARDSVVDGFGKVHGSSNLFVAGSSIFAGCSGAVNPTLTIVALAIRTTDNIIDQLL